MPKTVRHHLAVPVEPVCFGGKPLGNHQELATPNTIFRLRSVLRARGRSRTAHYNDINQGLFTPPVPLGPRAVGWPAYEVDMLNAARIAGKSDDEIRDLVKNLLVQRKAVA